MSNGCITANGPYAVSCHEDGALQVFEKYLTFYPSELETKAGKWPVIVICNGSGTPLSKYATVAEHFASWGFIVIGTEEKFSWNAFGAEMSLRYLEIMNGTRCSSPCCDLSSICLESLLQAL